MTLDEAKNYLRIDDNYDDIFIESLILVAENYIDSMVGEGYKRDGKAVSLSKLLQYKLIADMYENRSAEVENKTRQDRIVTSILDKLSNYEVIS